MKDFQTKSDITIATLGSHSALEVARGAKDEGFKNIVVCERGREKTYDTYYKTHGSTGCVDECLTLNKFDEILKPENQQKLSSRNSIFIPNRSFEAYLHFNYDAIENVFQIPMFGNRQLLRIEERGKDKNQYSLLDEAGIRYPKHFKKPEDIDRICLVKVQEKERSYERAFFIVESFQDYKKQVEAKLQLGVFTKEELENSVIEEFVVGVQVNCNFFYSPIHKRLELLGTDTRRQTNFEGFIRLPGIYQEEVMKKLPIQYEEAGHIATTVLESMLEQIFALGERFVIASKKLSPPGIIGPFALQSFIVPGPPKKDIIVVDVSPRFPGSPGIGATPYSGYLFGKSVTVGRRIAMEIADAIKLERLDDILT